MAIRKVISRSILDGTVAAVDLAGTASNISLNAISSTIGLNAYDVFVYNTSRDTDNGAWRKRTTHTSWYNETLNTATRGSRREFPSVAIIVATTTTVTIYDGDDAALPMWMVISANGILDWPTSTHTRLALTAANGQLGVASEDGVEIFNFVRDYVDLGYSGYYNITTSRTIAGRNDTTAYVSGSPATTGVSILLTWACYSISSAIIPNSYVDPATGLPNPTFAIGHGGAGVGGISIIQADRSVIKTSSGSYKVWEVNIQPDRSVYAAQSNASDSNWGYLMKKDYASLNGIDYQTYANWDYYYNYAGTGNLTLSNRLDYSITGVYPIAAAQGGAGGGLTLNAENRNSPANGMVAYINSSTNTGWLHGNNKLATLLSKTAGTVTGTELVSGGNFTSTKGGWTSQASSTATWQSTGGLTDPGCVAVTSVGGSNVYSTILLSNSLTVGQKYNFRVAYKGSASGSVVLRLSTAESATGTLIAAQDANNATTSYQYWTYQFTAPATTAYFSSWLPGGITAYFDDLSLSLANEIDWSLTSTPLSTYGTITKTAAVANTDVMQYSGWSASNYMFLPYQSWMNLANGPFSISTWVKMNDNSTTSCLLYCANYRGEADYWQLEQQSNGDWRFQIDRFEGAVIAMNNSIGTQWRHIVAVYVDTELKLYIDGVQVASNGTPNARFAQYTGTSTQNVDIDADSAGLTIGRRDQIGGVNAFNGSVAMLRISASAPDAAQVWKMFNDEKHFFSPGTSVVTNSKLYGNFDAVTAMAYDPDTNLLHVGTSAGRSVFNGLRRVDNTTTAVTTAISAANGFVVEQ
jgi:hypothetical protein